MEHQYSIADEISILIWKISKFWQRGMHRMMDEFGLTGPQLEILGAIHHFITKKQTITQVLLSQETGIDPMTTSTILRNLQKKGLITRKESETDTRARNVDITEEGAKLFLMAHDRVQLIKQDLFSNLDQKALKNQLEILLKELNGFDNQIQERKQH